MVNRGLLSQFNWSARLQRNLVWGLLIAGALVAFEAFNYSTTEFAMRDLLGDLRFGGIGWATILALAFCSIDFAGIAHMFSNGTNLKEKQGLEVWYLFAAWLLAATMNAILTWWGVSVAILEHGSLGNALLGRETLLQIVPAFVAVLVWLIRVLVIGTLITAGGKLFAAPGSTQRTMPPSLRRVQPSQNSRVAQPAMRHGLVPNKVDEPVYVDQGEF
ncbi:MAG: hypothetical protein M1347_05870 [Chloroflexi bacterium]|nr:hypothetical protein [Chloroflexota bacterium]